MLVARLCSLLEALGMNMFPCLFQLLETAHIPQLTMAPSFHRQNQHIASLYAFVTPPTFSRTLVTALSPSELIYNNLLNLKPADLQPSYFIAI